MIKEEQKLPTIEDVRDCLSGLVFRGLGGLPAKLLIVPEETMLAIATAGGVDAALLIELHHHTGGRMPVCLMTIENLDKMRAPPFSDNDVGLA